jgi:hypothetical protein
MRVAPSTAIKLLCLLFITAGLSSYLPVSADSEPQVLDYISEPDVQDLEQSFFLDSESSGFEEEDDQGHWLITFNTECYSATSCHRSLKETRRLVRLKTSNTPRAPPTP